MDSLSFAARYGNEYGREATGFQSQKPQAGSGRASVFSWNTLEENSNPTGLDLLPQVTNNYNKKPIHMKQSGFVDRIIDQGKAENRRKLDQFFSRGQGWSIAPTEYTRTSSEEHRLYGHLSSSHCILSKRNKLRERSSETVHNHKRRRICPHHYGSMKVQYAGEQKYRKSVLSRSKSSDERFASSRALLNSPDHGLFSDNTTLTAVLDNKNELSACRDMFKDAYRLKAETHSKSEKQFPFYETCDVNTMKRKGNEFLSNEEIENEFDFTPLNLSETSDIDDLDSVIASLCESVHPSKSSEEIGSSDTRKKLPQCNSVSDFVVPDLSTENNAVVESTIFKPSKGHRLQKGSSNSQGDASFRGVTFRPSGKWQAQCYFEGRSRYIGVFDTQKKASLAYKVAMKNLVDGVEHLKGEDTKLFLGKRIAEARSAAQSAVNSMKRISEQSARAA